jgi:hypothetical protein
MVKITFNTSEEQWLECLQKRWFGPADFWISIIRADNVRWFSTIIPTYHQPDLNYCFNIAARCDSVQCAEYILSIHGIERSGSVSLWWDVYFIHRGAAVFCRQFAQRIFGKPFNEIVMCMEDVVVSYNNTNM